jgi:hypothetical protein
MKTDESQFFNRHSNKMEAKKQEVIAELKRSIDCCGAEAKRIRKNKEYKQKLMQRVEKNKNAMAELEALPSLETVTVENTQLVMDRLKAITSPDYSGSYKWCELYDQAKAWNAHMTMRDRTFLGDTGIKVTRFWLNPDESIKRQEIGMRKERKMDEDAWARPVDGSQGWKRPEISEDGVTVNCAGLAMLSHQPPFKGFQNAVWTHARSDTMMSVYNISSEVPDEDDNNGLDEDSYGVYTPSARVRTVYRIPPNTRIEFPEDKKNTQAYSFNQLVVNIQ